MKRGTLVVATFVCMCNPVTILSASEQGVQMTVAGGKQDLAWVPLVVPIAKASVTADSVRVQDANGETYQAQLLTPGLLAAGANKSAAELHILLPVLKAEKDLKLRATFTHRPTSAGKGFSWQTPEESITELDFASRPVLRYMHKAFDDSTKEKREQTYKVFHHLYDPAGTRLVTKGPGGLYPHHRGIFFGFNKITYGNGKKADSWHCTGGAHQSHEKILASEAGSLVGRHRVEIAWHGEEKEIIAREERELTVYRLPGGTLVDFASVLRTTGGPLKLDGDPQHAGVHFRADNEVADKTSKETIYIRPSGVGKAGEEWNWPTQKDQVDLPWKAMSFVLGGKRYTAANLDRPENPKPARFSERTYGRFGSYFVYELTAEKPLAVRYRFWLQEGQMTPAEVAQMAAGFAEPPRVTVK